MGGTAVAVGAGVEAWGSPWGFCSVMTSDLWVDDGQPGIKREGVREGDFLKGTSDRRSQPPFMLSARKTLPVVAIATILECSEKGLKEMGSCISPEASLRE